MNMATSPLLTDLYQFTMLQAYLDHGTTETAVFDLFVRTLPKRRGFLLAAGLTFLIGLQAAINIGVVTSALPNKGLPLPFISYGGSNLLVMLVCVGLLFSIARHARPWGVFAADSVEADGISLVRAAKNPFARRRPANAT